LPVPTPAERPDQAVGGVDAGPAHGLTDLFVVQAGFIIADGELAASPKLAGAPTMPPDCDVLCACSHLVLP